MGLFILAASPSWSVAYKLQYELAYRPAEETLYFDKMQHVYIADASGSRRPCAHHKLLIMHDEVVDRHPTQPYNLLQSITKTK